MSELTPFIKWAGGKRAIMNALEERFPTTWNNYYEPFLGGGSVLLKILSLAPSDKPLYVSDISEPLILTYTVIKNSVNDLIVELNKEQYQWTSVDTAKELYLKNRDRFNHLKLMTYSEVLTKCASEHNVTLDQLSQEVIASKKTKLGTMVANKLKTSNPSSLFHVLSMEQQVEMAALFIFLNKIGFNGMYRENGYGLFNIPHGRTVSKPTIFKSEQLQALSKAFQNVTFTCNDYRTLLEKAQEGDFVYLDPPYAGEKMFTSYSKAAFGDEAQQMLCEEICKLHARGCKVMMSNSATDLICDLYTADKGFTLDKIDVRRYLGASVASRKNVVQEVIVRNYTD